MASENVGKVVEVKGVVIDVVFPGTLPEINTALRITVPGGDGAPGRELIAEVQQHLGDDRVRAVAMDSTDGLPRGVDVVDTGAPISVPVGKVTLGRLWNVLGEPVDQGERAEGAERWPIHRDPPPFRDLSPKAEIFETGIKVIDLIAPLVRGGGNDLCGGAGVGQDRRYPGTHLEHRANTAGTPSSPAWASATAKGTDTWHEMKDWACLPKMAIVVRRDRRTARSARPRRAPA